MRVAFRVDSTPAIGSGHLMRCLTLADALRARGAATHFLVREPAAGARALIEQAGHVLHALQPGAAHAPEDEPPPHAAWLGASQADDADACRPVLAGLRPEWLVVDHYALDRRWERALRPSVGRILAIDDLADRAHDCDALLDQNLHADAAQRYERLVPAGCRLLLGPRHALLRPEFARARAQRPPRDGRVERLLVGFGGVDRDDFTARALDAALALTPPCAVDVVVGSGYPHLDALRARCAGRSDVRLHVQTDRMGELLAEADLAVAAAGVSTWERLCAGLPAIVLAVAENQVPGLESLCEAGLVMGSVHARDLSADDLLAMLRALRLAPRLLAGMARRGAALVDGQGTRRVADALLPPSITLRPAHDGDCTDVHAWRNDASVRAQSHDARPIAYDDHRRWFAAALADPQRVLLIGEDAQGPVGVVRFDLSPPQATVSVYLVPARQAAGLGAPLIAAASRWMREHRPQVARLVAEILPRNLASARAFERAGYVADRHVYVASLRESTA